MFHNLDNHMTDHMTKLIFEFSRSHDEWIGVRTVPSKMYIKAVLYVDWHFQTARVPWNKNKARAPKASNASL